MAAGRITPKIVILTCFLQLALGLGSVRAVWADRPEVAMFYDALAPLWQLGRLRQIRAGVVSHQGIIILASPIWTAARCLAAAAGPLKPPSPGAGPLTTTATGCPPPSTAGSGLRAAPGILPRPLGAPAMIMSAGPPSLPRIMSLNQPFTPPEATPRVPVLDLLAAPLWIFARSSQFLLGFGQPYAPVYSYYNSRNSLAPFSYAPIVYGGTFPLTDFYYPDYAPMAFFGFGPPFPFVSRVSHVDIGQIHTFVNSHNFTMMHNVLPSGAVLGRYPFLRGAIPPVVLEGRGFPLTRVQDVARAERALKPPRGPGAAVRPAGYLPHHASIHPHTINRSRGAGRPGGHKRHGLAPPGRAALDPLHAPANPRASPAAGASPN